MLCIILHYVFFLLVTFFYIIICSTNLTTLMKYLTFLLEYIDMLSVMSVGLHLTCQNNYRK